jgi:Ca2+/Na+ antiporter
MVDFLDICLKIERMAPFAIVSYFLISGVFAGDFKLFIVFLGLIISAGLTSAISRFMADNIYSGMTNDEIVKQITTYSVFYFSSMPLSYVPLSINIYVFLLCYYMWVLFAYDKNITSGKGRKSANKTARKNAAINNMPLIIVLCILVIGDLIYLWYTFKNLTAIALPVIIGVLLGTTWPMIIGKANWAIPVKDLGAKCSATNMNYSCKLSTTGSLITGP